VGFLSLILLQINNFLANGEAALGAARLVEESVKSVKLIPLYSFR